MLKKDDRYEIANMISSEFHRRETAPLDRDHVERLLKIMTERMHSKAGFGVTLTEDHNGAWGGQLGQRQLTLRFGDGKDHITVSLIVKEINSFDVTALQYAFDTEDK